MHASLQVAPYVQAFLRPSLARGDVVEIENRVGEAVRGASSTACVASKAAPRRSGAATRVRYAPAAHHGTRAFHTHDRDAAGAKRTTARAATCDGGMA